MKTRQLNIIEHISKALDNPKRYKYNQIQYANRRRNRAVAIRLTEPTQQRVIADATRVLAELPEAPVLTEELELAIENQNEIIPERREGEYSIQYCNISTMSDNRTPFVKNIVDANISDIVTLVEINHYDKVKLELFGAEYNKIITPTIPPEEGHVFGPRKGGVFSFHKNNCNFKLSTVSENFRFQVNKTTLSHLGKCIQLMTVQFPQSTHVQADIQPGIDRDVMEWELFYEQFEDEIIRIKEQDGLPLVVGDINKNLSKIAIKQPQVNNQESILQDKCTSNDLFIVDPGTMPEICSTTQTFPTQLMVPHYHCKPFSFHREASGHRTRIDQVLADTSLRAHIRVEYLSHFEYGIDSEHSAIKVQIKPTIINPPIDDEDFQEQQIKTFDDRLLNIPYQANLFYRKLIEREHELVNVKSIKEFVELIIAIANEVIPITKITANKMDKEAKRLEKLAKQQQRRGETVLARQTTTQRQRYIRKYKKIAQDNKMKNAFKPCNALGRDAWQVARNQIKPKAKFNPMMKNEAGFQDMTKTMNAYMDYWEDIQYEKRWEEAMEAKEGKILTSILRQLGKEGLSAQLKVILPSQREQLLERPEEERFFVRLDLHNMCIDLVNYLQVTDVDPSDIEMNVFLTPEEEQVEQTPEELQYAQFSEQNVLSIIKQFSNHKAVGGDNVTKKLLISVTNRPRQLTKLTSLYNSQQEFFQSNESDKEFLLHHLPKGGDSIESPDKTRPISLTPLVQRIYEKLIKAEQNKKIKSFLPRTQFGFRAGHQCSDAINLVKLYFHEANYQGKAIVVIGTDFKKMFNKTKHEPIQEGILETEITERTLAAIINLNSGIFYRTRVITVRKQLSPKQLFNIGVGQGTVLGPNNADVSVATANKTSMTQFLPPSVHMAIGVFQADDINGIFIFKKHTRIPRMIKACGDYVVKLEKDSNPNGLTLNMDKTTYITNKPNLMDKYIPIGNNLEVQVSNNIKLYGVRLNVSKAGELRYKDHFKYLLKEVTTLTSAVMSTKNRVKHMYGQTAITMLNAFARSKVEQACETFQLSWFEKYFDQIDIKFRIFQKHALGLRYTTLNEAAQIASNTFQIKDRCQIRTLTQQIRKKQVLPIGENFFADLLKEGRQVQHQLVDLKLALKFSLHGIKINDLQQDIKGLSLYEQLDYLFLDTKIHDGIQILFKIQKLIKTLTKCKYILDIIDPEICKNNQIDIQMASKIIREFKTLVRETDEDDQRELFPRVRRTGILMATQQDPFSYKPRVHLNKHLKGYSKWLKLLCGSSRIGQRNRQHSLDIRNQLFTVTGYCLHCDVLETEEHWLNCQQLVDHRENFLIKFRDARFKFTSFDRICDLVRGGLFHELVFAEIDELERRQGIFFWDQSEFTLIDQFVKECVFDAFGEYNEQMVQMTNRGDRHDIIDRVKYTEQRERNNYNY